MRNAKLREQIYKQRQLTRLSGRKDLWVYVLLISTATLGTACQSDQAPSYSGTYQRVANENSANEMSASLPAQLTISHKIHESGGTFDHLLSVTFAGEQASSLLLPLRQITAQSADSDGHGAYVGLKISGNIEDSSGRPGCFRIFYYTFSVEFTPSAGLLADMFGKPSDSVSSISLNSEDLANPPVNEDKRSEWNAQLTQNNGSRTMVLHLKRNYTQAEAGGCSTDETGVAVPKIDPPAIRELDLVATYVSRDSNGESAKNMVEKSLLFPTSDDLQTNIWGFFDSYLGVQLNK